MKVLNRKKVIRWCIVFCIVICFFIVISNRVYSNSSVVYIDRKVYSGDTLWSICEDIQKNNKYYSKKDIRYIVFDLKRINCLDNSDLKIGDIIRVPSYL